MISGPTPSAISGQALATKTKAWRRWGILSLIVAAYTLPTVAHTRPHYGGTLRIEIEGDPWQRPDGLARRLVLDGLTEMSVDGRVQPALAVEWKSENDDHRWQFRLRAGVHFHDGTAVNSGNVVASLSAICGAGCPWTSVRAVGSSIVFLSDAPLPNLPELLAADEYRIGLSGAETSTAPVGSIGTGPFQFASFSSGVLTLAANENCWQGRAFLDAVEIHAHRGIHDQWLDLSVGRADIGEVPTEQLRQAHEQRFNVVVSMPASLLALTVSDSGALANANLRAAIALAVDRSALSNVIFQKQGEITASLLPAELTGYSFLFSTERDLNKARELRGGVSPPMLTMVAEGGPVMQLAVQRIALNLRDAGFNVQVANAGAPQHVDMTLRRLQVQSGEPGPALESMMRASGLAAPVQDQTPAGLYKVEREALETHMVIPLLYLPCAYAIGGRVRDFRMGFDGAPRLDGVSLEDAP
jgi:peptide/nickel transport system substrate-binding protein